MNFISLARMQKGTGDPEEGGLSRNLYRNLKTKNPLLLE